MGASFLAFGRMILVLGLIIGILFLLARLVQKFQAGAGGPLGVKQPGRIDVLSRRSLGKNVSVMVVRVAHHTFLVGQSAQQITLLAELEGDEWVEAQPATAITDSKSDRILAPRTALGTGGYSPGAWDALIDRLREMTVRH